MLFIHRVTQTRQGILKGFGRGGRRHNPRTGNVFTGHLLAGPTGFGCGAIMA